MDLHNHLTYLMAGSEVPNIKDIMWVLPIRFNIDLLVLDRCIRVFWHVCMCRKWSSCMSNTSMLVVVPAWADEPEDKETLLLYSDRVRWLLGLSCWFLRWIRSVHSGQQSCWRFFLKIKKNSSMNRHVKVWCGRTVPELISACVKP